MTTWYQNIDLDDAQESHVGPARTFTTEVFATLDATPLLAAVYRPDYRAQEESGSQRLRETFTAPGSWRPRTNPARACLFNDVNALALSTAPVRRTAVWGEDFSLDAINEPLDAHHYDGGWDEAVLWSRESELTEHQNVTPEELTRRLVNAGVTDIPQRKSQMLRVMSGVARAARPHVWPGYFHYGEALVLRADTGLSAQMLTQLRDAVATGNLSITTGEEYGYGLALFDARDVGPLQGAAWDQDDAWRAEQMAALGDVREDLHRKGHIVISLGTPRIDKGRTVYLIETMQRSTRQALAAWMTLAEIEALA